MATHGLYFFCPTCSGVVSESSSVMSPNNVQVKEPSEFGSAMSIASEPGQM